MLEKEDGVIAALPFSDRGRVEVWAAKKGALDAGRAEAVIHVDKDFKVTGFRVGSASESRRASNKTSRKRTGKKKTPGPDARGERRRAR